MATPRAPRTTSWYDAEPPLWRSWWELVGRLLRRARASWALWLPLAALMAGGFTVMRARKAAVYEATVVLRVTETTGQTTTGVELGNGMLRARVNELAFTNARLLELMARHPKSFGPVAKDPDGALEDLRKATNVVITDSDFIEDRGAGDPPRSARVSVGFKAATPELALSVAHELADLIIGATRAREQAALESISAAAAASRGHAESHLDAAGVGANPVGRGPADPRVDSALARFKEANQRAAAMEIAGRAAADQQTLRMEIVDPGHLPEPITREGLVGLGLAALGVALLLGALVAGAFDPRVLDSADLDGAGLTPLGRLPPLPGAPAARGGDSSR